MRLFPLLLLTFISSAIFIASSTAPTTAKEKVGNPKFAVRQLSRHVSIITSVPDYTNIGYITETGQITVIDPGMKADYVAAFLPFLKSVQKDNVTVILNTHNHSDHTNANDLLIKQGARLQTSSAGLMAYTVRSHADTDSIFHHPSDNIIFIGDILENGWHPTFYAGGLDGFNKALEKLISVSDEKTVFIPGHGAPMTQSDLKTAQENTKNWVAEVKRQLSKDKTIDQMMQSKRLNAVLQTFNTTHSTPFLPERAHKRFIERTIAIIK